ncbi:MAG: hypothetical protein KBC11_03240 [Candidatus Pacebacteria bacterium]|nr:hypothetical protein [Candidatus Paceibacterota bacterium]
MKIQIKSFILIFSILVLDTKTAFADEKFIILAPKEVFVGESFSVSVLVSSPSQAMNAISGSIKSSGGISLSSVNKNSSIVNFWTSEPKVIGVQIPFEGVVLNPGYQGNSGNLFKVSLVARSEGVGTLSFSEGAILANDGLGSNIIDSLASVSIKIKPSSIKVDSIPSRPIAIVTTNGSGKIVALPVITEYPESIDSKSRLSIKGKGEPNALTKIIFKDISIKSLGEQFIYSLQSKKNKPTEALVRNDEKGFFQYLSAENLVAGAYNVTPFLVEDDQQTQKPGFGVQLLVNNSKMVKWLVVLINVLALLIPIVCLIIIIIYFIPWYSRLRMKILNHKIKIEDERLSLSEKELKQKEENITSV